MIDKKIVIAALARDCNEALINNIPRIEKLRELFTESHVVIVENDSKDGTKDTLQKWQEKATNIHLLINDYGTETIPQASNDNPHPATSLHRIEKMTNYRNMYLEHIRSLKIDFDYLIIIDVDIKYFCSNDVINTIKNAPKDWAVLFAFGQENAYIGKIRLKTLMYDMFAYVHRQIPHPFTEKYMFVQKRKIVKRIKKETYSPCISAFGGLAIYKWNYIKSQLYQIQLNNDSMISVLCEHIPFNHRVIEQGGNNYIAKQMIVDYGKCSYKIAFRMIFPEIIFRMFKFIFR